MSKLNIKVVDMENQVTETAKKSINEAFENYREERFIANKIKEDFDKVYGKCISTTLCNNLFISNFHKYAQ